MRRTASILFLGALGLASAVNGAFSMGPCSPRQAIVGTLLGGIVGVLAARSAVRARKEEVPLARRLVQGIGFWALLSAVILVLYFIRIRVPALPDWTEPIADFFTGGMYLTLIAAPFTMGACVWFHVLGAGAPRSEREW